MRYGDYMVISIEDDGCGMEQDVCEKIFEPFYSTHFSGRGMAVAYGMIKNHGGHISVESQSGKGSHFHVCLPLDAMLAHVSDGVA